MTKFIDLTGVVFGRLTAISVEKNNGNGPTIWLCSCVCGGIARSAAADLRRGHVLSCGCLKRERIASSATTHGKHNSRIYKLWLAMVQRCTNQSNPKFKRYGARGITVCDRWKSFVNFYEDMGDRPSGLSLERTNNDLGYPLDNCVWATPKEQNTNKSNNVLLTYEGKTLAASQWAEIACISADTLRKRLSRGWSIEKIMTTPLRGL